MTLLVVASGLYRLLVRRMRGYVDAQARRIFQDLVDMPASAIARNPYFSPFQAVGWGLPSTTFYG